MRLSARTAWELARIPNAISKVFTWHWAAWWTAALLRFAITGQTITITRNNPSACGRGKECICDEHAQPGDYDAPTGVIDTFKKRHREEK
jgi:hypothetical protein